MQSQTNDKASSSNEVYYLPIYPSKLPEKDVSKEIGLVTSHIDGVRRQKYDFLDDNGRISAFSVHEGEDLQSDGESS